MRLTALLWWGFGVCASMLTDEDKQKILAAYLASDPQEMVRRGALNIFPVEAMPKSEVLFFDTAFVDGARGRRRNFNFDVPYTVSGGWNDWPLGEPHG